MLYSWSHLGTFGNYLVCQLLPMAAMALLPPLPSAGELWFGQLNKDLRINNPHKGAANQDILLRFLCNNNHLHGADGV